MVSQSLQLAIHARLRLLHEFPNLRVNSHVLPFSVVISCRCLESCPKLESPMFLQFPRLVILAPRACPLVFWRLLLPLVTLRHPGGVAPGPRTRLPVHRRLCHRAPQLLWLIVTRAVARIPPAFHTWLCERRHPTSYRRFLLLPICFENVVYEEVCQLIT